MMELQVHLIQGFLHVMHVGRRHLHPALSMSQQRPYRADCLLRAERGTQQTHRVEILQPLAVRHIRLSPGHILHVPGIDQTHVKPLRFQDLE